MADSFLCSRSAGATLDENLSMGQGNIIFSFCNWRWVGLV